MDINWGKTVLWTAGIGAVGYGGWTAYNYYNMSKGGLQVGNPKIAVKNKIHVDLPITNVTASSITVTGVTAGLLINGKQVIDLTETQTIEVSAHATTMIPFEVSPNWIGLAIAVGQLGVQKIKNGTFSELDATVQGNLFISNIRIPFSKAVV